MLCRLVFILLIINDFINLIDKYVLLNIKPLTVLIININVFEAILSMLVQHVLFPLRPANGP